MTEALRRTVFVDGNNVMGAADERILELLDADAPGSVQVVTSDRALADGARQRGASVTGAGAFLRRLHDTAC
ncbi:MAG: YacP-like domain [Acidimicrobiaceae bacterium]